MNDEQRPKRETPAFDDVIKPSHKDYDSLFEVHHDNHDDPVSKQKRRKKIRILVISILLLLGLVAGGFLVYRIYDTQVAQQRQMEEEQARLEQERQEQSAFEPTLPVRDAYGDSDIPTTDVTTIVSTVDDGDFVTSEEYTLSHAEFNLRAPEIKCTVSRGTDFCFAGELRTGDDNPGVNTYFLKDAPNSRLFEDAENFATVELQGASLAAVMTMQLGGEDTAALIVVYDDGTGHLFTAPNGDIPFMESLAADMTVS